MAAKRNRISTRVLSWTQALAISAGFIASAEAQTRQLRKPGVVVLTKAVENGPLCRYGINGYGCLLRGSRMNAPYYLVVVRDPSGRSEVIVTSPAPYQPGKKVLVVFEPNGDIWIAPPTGTDAGSR